MERAALTVHGNDGVANEDVVDEAGTRNGSVKGSAKVERGKVTAGFENEREGVVVGGPTEGLHTTVKA